MSNDQTPEPIHNNILETLGNTPLVRLNKVVGDLESEIIAKCEFFNPGGSVKDRIGIAMIEDAEKRGIIKPGGTIIECTSGNTGVGLAIAATIKGYKCVFVMPDKMSQEKINTLRAYGAKVVITPTAVEPEDPSSYYSVAKRLAKETSNSIHLNQYDNLSNRQAHYRLTGPELWKQTNGNFDAFVAGMGTGGTITGTAMYLKEKKKEIQIVGVDPKGSILHDYFRTGKMSPAHVYKIEGIGEDFIPKNYDFSVIDDVVQVDDKESFQMTRELLLKEGIFAGVSAGSAIVGAIRYARKQKQKKRIIVLIPDSGNRYLSKVFNDDWMRENSFLDDGLGTVNDLLDSLKKKDPVITANKTDSVEKLIHLMKDKGISQIPVMDGKTILGLISEHNLLNALFVGKITKSDKIEGLVEANFAEIQLRDPIEKLNRLLASGQIPLVIENGNIISIVTKIDIIAYLGNRKG